MRPLFLFFCIMLLSAWAGQAQNAANYAHLYQATNPYRPVAQYTVQSQTGNQLQLKIKFAEAGAKTFRWYYQPTLLDSLPGRKNQITTDAAGWLSLPLDTAQLATNSWIMLEPTAAPENIIPVWLAPAKKFGAGAFYPEQEVKNTKYQASADALRLLSYTDDTLYVFGYQEDFTAATTPMAAPTPGDMTITQRLYTTQPDTLALNDEGFYYLQTDTTGLAGAGLRVVSPYFPQTRRPVNFAGPIRYLSTQEEWNELQRADFSKEALDRFWFRMTQSQDLARKIIRQYYRGVAQANQLFTGFKEGWKTDQGMIYILYGAPPKVTLLPNGDEEWAYPAQDNLPPITFTFARTLNPFTEPYFQLVRNRNYARTHYQVINRWRRGTDLQ